MQVFHNNNNILDMQLKADALWVMSHVVRSSLLLADWSCSEEVSRDEDSSLWVPLCRIYKRYINIYEDCFIVKSFISCLYTSHHL